MAEKKYVSLSKLSDFLDNLRNTFAPLVHTHTFSDIADFKIDNALSPTSSNPVSNSVLDAEFEAISQALDIYETELDGKANSIHTHSDASTSSSGFMSASDKTKLNGIETGANAYTLPASSSSVLGGLKVRLNGTTLYIRNDGIDA